MPKSLDFQVQNFRVFFAFYVFKVGDPDIKIKKRTLDLLFLKSICLHFLYLQKVTFRRIGYKECIYCLSTKCFGRLGVCEPVYQVKDEKT